ncbi:hypothetical protein EFM66_07395 [Streptococcus thermophilus]|nr:hypothetical protein [Streptococcus thermophilus]MCT2930417.1 hypothetical protein [Streptococcus thermophilus]MCT2937401.1 hypothetical protein [Streptococcus thermophilus]MCT2939132.1 hypothetical protein [Streptococcus thermophilus]MCT2945459.1 hypothetical protein [Streptococcus thermophilus]
MVLGLMVIVLIAIRGGRFWEYQENHIIDGTYQMVKWEATLAYLDELVNWTKRGRRDNDTLHKEFIVVENMKSQFYSLSYGDGKPFVSLKES